MTNTVLTEENKKKLDEMFKELTKNADVAVRTAIEYLNEVIKKENHKKDKISESETDKKGSERALADAVLTLERMCIIVDGIEVKPDENILITCTAENAFEYGADELRKAIKDNIRGAIETYLINEAMKDE